MKSIESNQESDTKSGMKSGMKSEYSFFIPRGVVAFPIDSTIGKVYTALKQAPSISISTLSSIIGISRSTIQKHIENLKKYGIIQRVGPDKGGHWEIIAAEENGGKQ